MIIYYKNQTLRDCFVLRKLQHLLPYLDNQVYLFPACACLQSSFPLIFSPSEMFGKKRDGVGGMWFEALFGCLYLKVHVWILFGSYPPKHLPGF